MSSPVNWNGRRRIRVYYAAPYSSPYPIHNMYHAMQAWLKLWKAGYIPTCPHWTGFQDLMTPLPYQDWLEYDNFFLPFHHAVLRDGGPSNGADREVKPAQDLGILVFGSFDELLRELPPDTDPYSLVYNPQPPEVGCG